MKNLRKTLCAFLITPILAQSCPTKCKPPEVYESMQRELQKYRQKQRLISKTKLIKSLQQSQKENMQIIRTYEKDLKQAQEQNNKQAIEHYRGWLQLFKQSYRQEIQIYQEILSPPQPTIIRTDSILDKLMRKLYRLPDEK